MDKGQLGRIEEMGGDVGSLLKEAVILLEKKGWNVIVIGGVGVRQPDETRQHHYWLAIEFLGVKREES